MSRNGKARRPRRWWLFVGEFGVVYNGYRTKKDAVERLKWAFGEVHFDVVQVEEVLPKKRARVK